MKRDEKDYLNKDGTKKTYVNYTPFGLIMKKNEKRAMPVNPILKK